MTTQHCAATHLVAPFTILLALTLMSSAGCHSVLATYDWPWGTDATSSTADRMLPIWTDTTLHQAGQSGVRGFGGRIYFYQDGDADPVEVSGQLTVYVFEGNEVAPGRAEPLRKFVFTEEQFASHHSKTSLGDSYSVWLPWDKVGGPTRNLSLVARFDGEQTGTLISKPSTKSLPGVEPVASNEPRESAGVAQATYVAPVTEERSVAMEQLPNSYTIALPPRFQQRVLLGSVVAESSTLGGSAAVGYREEVTETASGERPSDSPSKAQPGLEDHFGPQRFPLRKEPKLQPGRAAVRRLPHPGGWPSSLPLTPRRNNYRQNNAPVAIPEQSPPLTSD